MGTARVLHRPVGPDLGSLAIIGTRTCAVYQYNKIVVGIFGLLGTFIAVVAVVSLLTMLARTPGIDWHAWTQGSRSNRFLHRAVVAQNPKARMYAPAPRST